MSKWEVLLCEIDEETGYLLGGSPIVHCKDCKWWSEESEYEWDGETELKQRLCTENDAYFDPDDFCSYGERREDEHLVMPPADGSTIPQEYLGERE